MMVKNKPLVTVLMAVYNGADHVEGAVESILAQTYDAFEFIIINDGSTDNTAEILSSFRDPRLRILTQDNMGLTKSLNIGIHLAKGEFIARQDADDRSMGTRLEEQLKAFQKTEDLGLIGTSVVRIQAKLGVRDEHYPPESDSFCRHALRTGKVCIYHSSAMFRREHAGQLFLYDESLVQAQDFGMWISIAKGLKIGNLQKLLHVGIREAPGSITGRRSIWHKIKLRQGLGFRAWRQLDGSVAELFELEINVFKVLVLGLLQKIRIWRTGNQSSGGGVSEFSREAYEVSWRQSR